MCIICVKNGNKKIPNQWIKNCWDNNNDGAGVVWLENGVFYFQKGFENYKDFKKFWDRKSSSSKISAFHCRIATHGGVKPLLTHPFYIDRNENELNGFGNLAMHNGVLSEKVYKDYFTDCDSDTSAFCKKIFNENLSNKTIEKETETSRFVIFKNGKFKLFGKWIYENGVFFSNDSYNYEKPKYNYFKTDYSKYSFYPVSWYGDRITDINGNEIKNTKNLYSDDGFTVYEYFNGKYRLRKDLFIDDDFDNYGLMDCKR